MGLGLPSTGRVRASWTAHLHMLAWHARAARRTRLFFFFFFLGVVCFSGLLHLFGFLLNVEFETLSKPTYQVSRDQLRRGKEKVMAVHASRGVE